MKALAILGVKNEAAFLLEWLAHHRATGFTDFLVFSNDCSDGTDAMLDRLDQMGWLTHVRDGGAQDRAAHDKGPQWALLKTADLHPAKAAADWVLFCDIDEFVNVHIGEHTLSDLVAALPQADAIALTWRMFGNAGVIEFTDQPITETFTRAAPETLAWPWRAQLFKTLFRNDGHWRKLGVHRPRSPAPGTTARWFDGSGREVPDLAQGQRVFSDYSRPNYGLVQLNHYALGAMQSYLVKCDRGRANREASGFDMGYWVDRNLSEVEDRSILALNSTDLRHALLADPVLGPLHRSAVQWRHDRFAALMAEEPWRALFGRLLMTPPSQALTAARAAPLAAHLRPATPRKAD